MKPGGLKRHLDAWRSAWRERHRGAGLRRRASADAEFLPAILEIQDTPPSPVGRAIGAVIVGVFVTALLWASVGEVDVVAVASGKIIPSGHSKVIQPLERGIVRAIHVHDGEPVSKGQVLVELDPTETAADHQRLTQEYQALLADRARLGTLLTGRPEIGSIPGVPAHLLAVQGRRLEEQRAEYQARVKGAKHLIAQRKAALEGTKATIARLERTVPMLEEQAGAYRRLVEQGYVSRVEYLASEKARVEEAQELARQREVLLHDSAALAEAEQDHQALVAEFHQKLHAELVDTETGARSLSQEIIKAEQRSRRQALTAPTDGVVQQLAIHTVGGVVTPAQTLMMIVPHMHTLEVEAWVANKDIGFVETGQPVEVKVESFPFTRFGVVHGEIVNLSRDAVPLEQGGLAYAARVSMAQSTIRVEDKDVNLSPGMAVRVEIKTGTRRLLEFFLSPLLRGLHETARER